jgi:hypothetical protein
MESALLQALVTAVEELGFNSWQNTIGIGERLVLAVEGLGQAQGRTAEALERIASAIESNLAVRQLDQLP